MRRTLALLSAAVTGMVALAFLIPFGLVVTDTARDRALSDAERQAASVAPTLAITTEPEPLERAIISTQGGSPDRIGMHLPPDVRIGTVRATDAQIASARKRMRAAAVPVPGGHAMLRPVRMGNGDSAVVEVFLPKGALTEGVATAWVLLGGVALALVLGSVAVADRLGAKMVRSSRRLAEAAHRFGEGDLDTRVQVNDGPPELRAVGQAFNAMASRIEAQVRSERELAADLSHRLRTPLTALRLNVDNLEDSAAAEQSRQAVARLENEVDEIISTVRERDASPRVEYCDAAEVLSERLGFWSVLAEDQGRAWELSGADQPAMVPVARGDLSAAVDALIGNVFRHTPEGTGYQVQLTRPAPDRANAEGPAGAGLATSHGPGSGHGSIGAKGEPVPAGDVTLVIGDGGAGIEDPEAALARGASGAGSTGLGLDIARRLASSTGGDLRIARSSLGGAEISLTLRSR